MRRIVELVLFPTLLAFSGFVFAQSGVKQASASPFQKQLAIEFTSGTRLIADYDTSRVYITGDNGSQYEVTFEDAVAAEESDPTKRQQLLSTFRSSLQDLEHIVTIRSARVATDDTYWPNPEWCGDVICIDPLMSESGESTRVTSSGSRTFTATDCDFMCEPFPCDLGPCFPGEWDGGFFYSGYGAGWDEEKGGGTVTQQELLAYDKQQFERYREDACGDKTTAQVETAALAGGVVAACATVETGIGAIACAGVAIAYGSGLYRIDKADKDCQASYPGIGKW